MFWDSTYQRSYRRAAVNMHFDLKENLKKKARKMVLISHDVE